MQADMRNSVPVDSARRSRPGGVAAMPGFYESVRLLVLRDGYSVAAVAGMFGISRERLRQLLADAVWSRRGRSYHQRRMWDDAAARFVPVRREAELAQRRVVQQERQTRVAAARAQKYARRHARVVRAIRERHAALGRVPTVGEVCAACGLSPAYASLAAYVTGQPGAGKAAVRALYAAAGLRPRVPGHRGRVAPRGAAHDCALCGAAGAVRRGTCQCCGAQVRRGTAGTVVVPAVGGGRARRGG